jgi:hypothetical protein
LQRDVFSYRRKRACMATIEFYVNVVFINPAEHNLRGVNTGALTGDATMVLGISALNLVAPFFYEFAFWHWRQAEDQTVAAQPAPQPAG